MEKKQQHELLLDSCTYNLSNRQARLTFGEWKLKTRMSITASQFRDVTCLSNCFRTWRLNCRAHKLIALRSRGQVWDIYRDWYLKQRLARLQRLHNTTLASSAMAQWQFRLEEKDTQVNEKLSNFEIYLDMRIAKRVFHTWKTRRTEVLNMELDAEALYYDNIATASLFTLLHQYDVTVHNSTKAITISKEKTLSRYFHIWKNASLQHKKRNAYALLDRYTIEKEQRLKQKFFTQWDDKYLEKEDLVFQALSFYSHTNRTLQQKYLGQWLIRTIEITNQIEEAAEQIIRIFWYNRFSVGETPRYQLTLLTPCVLKFFQELDALLLLRPFESGKCVCLNSTWNKKWRLILNIGSLISSWRCIGVTGAAGSSVTLLTNSRKCRCHGRAVRSLLITLPWIPLILGGAHQV